MEIADSNFADAECALSKASLLDQNDSTATILLAYSQFMQGHLQTAIASSQRAHKLGRPHAFAHRIAARGFVQLGQLDRAAEELRVAMEEDPAGHQGSRPARKGSNYEPSRGSDLASRDILKGHMGNYYGRNLK